MNYGGHHLNVLMGKGTKPFFASVWMDWYRSNASEPYALDKIEQGIVRLNGGVRYLPRTDGKRNGLFERVFLTFSKTFEETCPQSPIPRRPEGKKRGQDFGRRAGGQKIMLKKRDVPLSCGPMASKCSPNATMKSPGETTGKASLFVPWHLRPRGAMRLFRNMWRPKKHSAGVPGFIRTIPIMPRSMPSGIQIW